MPTARPAGSVRVFGYSCLTPRLTQVSHWLFVLRTLPWTDLTLPKDAMELLKHDIAHEFPELADKIHANSGLGTIPTPITMEELEDMLLDFGIMKTEEQQLAELAAKEAAKAAAASA